MGSSQKEAKAKVDVALDNIIFLPGGNITGKINILPKDKRDTQKFMNPQITFSILQQQNWQSFIFSENQKSSSNGEERINDFCQKTTNFSEFRGRLISEGIIIPFSYQISNDITPSLEWPHAKHEFAYIRNFFCVKIPELDFYTQILIIIQKPPFKLQSPLTVKAEEERKQYIFFGGRRIVIEGSYPQSSYIPLDTIPITVSVDTSESNFRVKDVTVKLKRKLQFYYKNSDKPKRNILQLMYYETKKVNDKKEKILFNIPFKDGNDIEYYNPNSLVDKVGEICCLLPNVNTDIIVIFYYIKIIAVLDGLLAQNIKLRMMVDFFSKDEKNKNKNAFDFLEEKVTSINHGTIQLNNEDPYLNHNNNLIYFGLNDNSVFIGGNPEGKNNNNEMNMFNNNINNIQNNNFDINHMFVNNNENNNDLNTNNNKNINNNFITINNNNGNLMNNNIGNNQISLPRPPEKEEELDFPSLEEIERDEYYKNKYKKVEYPQV